MNDAVPQTGAGPAPEQGTGPQASPERDTGAPPAEPRPAPDHHPAGPAPLGVPREDTGAPEVDALLGRLADADHLTTDGHLEVYEDVHRGLRDTLTALDARPGPPAPPSAHGHRS
ncbi:hypothetical protein ABZ606_28660 [Streptomyces sp. NPDC012461]|jgi:hypothetical protein|uniref:Uncharacterized protein n=2 Tax=unclassified Streptomyces TaxID=2593676 RepID=A0A6G3QMP2_9ACTN|nr:MULTISPECIES: hypothetical protein [unclassified Streptomyces]MBM7089090.1 hypothetical protein [Streptomyces sp. S12]NEA84572.1 hypothetical protein [Streptomyces sp. SID14436]NED18415.1 hypothetical protein [Streptomyces sp. SID9913]